MGCDEIVSVGSRWRSSGRWVTYILRRECVVLVERMSVRTCCNSSSTNGMGSSGLFGR